MNWTDDELKRSIVAYLEMLKYEKEKTSYSKSEINKKLQAELKNRGRSSIEYRWQNISSVLFDHNLNFIKGYKPAKNVGSNVKERIWKILNDLKFDQ